MSPDSVFGIRSTEATPWRVLGLTAGLSLALHGLIWTLCHQVDLSPEQQPEQIIEVQLVTIPRPAPEPVAPPAPPTPPKPPEPKPPEPKPAKPAPPKRKPIKEVRKPKPAIAPQPPPEKPAKPEAAQSPPVASTALAPAPTGPVRAAIPAAPAKPNCEKLRADHYPNIALQRGWQGTVRVKIQILANGTPGEVKVIESSGHEVLDEEALERAKNIRCQPHPHAYLVIQPFNFHLNNK